MALAQNRVAHARAFASHVNSAHLGFRIQTVGHHAAADHRHDRGDVLVVGAQHRHAVKGQTTDEVDEGLLQTDEIMPVGVHVILVNVGDRGDHGREIEKTRVRLIGLGNDVFARTKFGVGAGTVQTPADHVGGIKPSCCKHRGGERRRRGLAVRTGNGNAPAQAHEFGKHHGARHHGNVGLARGLHFGVAFVHSRRNDKAVGPVNVFLAMPLVDRGTQMLQAFRDRALRQVRAAYRITEVQKDFGNAAHARTADAYEVNVFDDKLHFSFSSLLIGPLPRSCRTQR